MTAVLRSCSRFVVAFALARSVAQAGPCMPPTVQKDSAYHYLASLAEAMSYAKSGQDRSNPANSGVKAEGSVDAYAFMLGLKLGKVDFECAGSQVSPYVTSSNRAIETSAKSAAMVFSRLGNLHEQSVAEEKAFLDSIGSQKVKPGTFLERQAVLGASYDEVWKMLVMAAIAGTYAVVEVEPKTGLMSGLALTRAQRDEILKKLRSTFGDQVTKGMKAGQTSLVAAASVLYQVVGDPERKLRESK